MRRGEYNEYNAVHSSSRVDSGLGQVSARLKDLTLYSVSSKARNVCGFSPRRDTESTDEENGGVGWGRGNWTPNREETIVNDPLKMRAQTRRESFAQLQNFPQDLQAFSSYVLHKSSFGFPRQVAVIADDSVSRALKALVLRQRKSPAEQPTSARVLLVLQFRQGRSFLFALIRNLRGIFSGVFALLLRLSEEALCGDVFSSPLESKHLCLALNLKARARCTFLKYQWMLRVTKSSVRMELTMEQISIAKFACNCHVGCRFESDYLILPRLVGSGKRGDSEMENAGSLSSLCVRCGLARQAQESM